MKTIITLILCLSISTVFAQSTDENGRPVGAKPANVINAEVGSFIQKDPTSTASSFKINFQLPQGMNSGKIKLFDARVDRELKSLDITASGSETINLKEYDGKVVVAAIYDSQGKFIQELRLN